MSRRLNKPRTAKVKAQVERAKYLGAWLFHIRTKVLKTSQGKLAKSLNVARTTVSSWESGDYPPATEKLIALSNLLDPASTLDALRLAGVDVERLRYILAEPLTDEIDADFRARKKR